MFFSTKRVKPDSPKLQIDNVDIDLCDKVIYLGVIIDSNLRFEDHVNNVVTKANQRMFVVKTFCNQSTSALSAMLFKSFIISILTIGLYITLDVPLI